MYSVIIPVYKNEEGIPDLLRTLEDMDRSLDRRLEVVFVVDGSPDRSFQVLNERLSLCHFSSRVILLSKNFGVIPAVQAGLSEATGTYFAVMAADLQEPPELLIQFFRCLQAGEADVTLGIREERDDPPLTQLLSNTYWWIYQKMVDSQMPRGGVDIFGCNQAFRSELLQVRETNTSLIGLIFWLGFRRKFIPYKRRKRQYGRSAWSLPKKIRYMSDSIFSFTDLPIRVLGALGLLGLVSSFFLGVSILIGKQMGWISVPGYSATVTMILFFAGINCTGFSILGSYVWRAYENTKNRPLSVVMDRYQYAREKDRHKKDKSKTPTGFITSPPLPQNSYT